MEHSIHLLREAWFYPGDTLSPVFSQVDSVGSPTSGLPHCWKQHAKSPSLLIVASKNGIPPLCENPHFFLCVWHLLEHLLNLI